MKEKKYTAVNEFGCATDGDVFEQVHGTDMWHMHREEEGAIAEMFLSKDIVQGLVETGYLAEVCEATKDQCAEKLESLLEFVDDKLKQYEEDRTAMLDSYNNQEIPTCVKVEAETVYYNMTKVLNKVKEIITNEQAR